MNESALFSNFQTLINKIQAQFIETLDRLRDQEEESTLDKSLEQSWLLILESLKNLSPDKNVADICGQIIRSSLSDKAPSKNLPEDYFGFLYDSSWLEELVQKAEQLEDSAEKKLILFCLKFNLFMGEEKGPEAANQYVMLLEEAIDMDGRYEASILLRIHSMLIDYLNRLYEVSWLENDPIKKDAKIEFHFQRGRYFLTRVDLEKIAPLYWQDLFRFFEAQRRFFYYQEKPNQKAIIDFFENTDFVISQLIQAPGFLEKNLTTLVEIFVSFESLALQENSGRIKEKSRYCLNQLQQFFSEESLRLSLAMVTQKLNKLRNRIATIPLLHILDLMRGIVGSLGRMEDSEKTLIISDLLLQGLDDAVNEVMESDSERESEDKDSKILWHLSVIVKKILSRYREGVLGRQNDFVYACLAYLEFEYFFGKNSEDQHLQLAEIANVLNAMDCGSIPAVDKHELVYGIFESFKKNLDFNHADHEDITAYHAIFKLLNLCDFVRLKEQFLENFLNYYLDFAIFCNEVGEENLPEGVIEDIASLFLKKCSGSEKFVINVVDVGLGFDFCRNLTLFSVENARNEEAKSYRELLLDFVSENQEDLSNRHKMEACAVAFDVSHNLAMPWQMAGDKVKLIEYYIAQFDDIDRTQPNVVAVHVSGLLKHYSEVLNLLSFLPKKAVEDMHAMVKHIFHSPILMFNASLEFPALLESVTVWIENLKEEKECLLARNLILPLLSVLLNRHDLVMNPVYLTKNFQDRVVEFEARIKSAFPSLEALVSNGKTYQQAVVQTIGFLKQENTETKKALLDFKTELQAVREENALLRKRLDLMEGHVPPDPKQQSISKFFHVKRKANEEESQNNNNNVAPPAKKTRESGFSIVKSTDFGKK